MLKSKVLKCKFLWLKIQISRLQQHCLPIELKIFKKKSRFKIRFIVTHQLKQQTKCCFRDKKSCSLKTLIKNSTKYQQGTIWMPNKMCIKISISRLILIRLIELLENRISMMKQYRKISKGRRPLHWKIGAPILRNLQIAPSWQKQVTCKLEAHKNYNLDPHFMIVNSGIKILFMVILKARNKDNDFKTNTKNTL